MSQSVTPLTTSFADSRPHYLILDGLRGTAALLVLIYHVFEGLAFAGGDTTPIWGINHGYLAVDFFFILSGFVIGYAYDDRLRTGRLTVRGFIRRRLIRLHPMIIAGAVIGAVAFFAGGGTKWDGTHVTTSLVMLSLLCALFMIPQVPGSPADVRGNGEMYPLNGPSWSLFFEYIGNLLYVLLIHRLPTRVLGVLTVVAGVALGWFALADLSGYGMLGVGWTLDTVNFAGGMLRMLFPYLLGMYLARRFVHRPAASGARRRGVRGWFWIASVWLLALFLVPYIDGKTPVCWNGAYELFCIVVVFPAIVWIGAVTPLDNGLSRRCCDFMGRLSYPLYAVHYPVMYVFYQWLIAHEIYTLAGSWPQALLAVGVSIVLALVALKCYDEPFRRWLSRKWK